MGLGPQQMPPQGARALVSGLLRGWRSGPDVVATLDESDRAGLALEFVNDGGGTATDLRFVVEKADGSLHAGAVGNLAPGATERRSLGSAADLPGAVRCAWWYGDAKARVLVRSYDGRRKRLRRTSPDDAGAVFRAAYD